MKIEELRTLVKDMSKTELEESLTSIYKLLRKFQKEEADAMILQARAADKNAKQKKEPQSVEELLEEVHTFIDLAQQGYYFYSNAVVTKSERSKWRFKVKRYIKQLQEIEPDHSLYAVALGEFMNLYLLLSYACESNIFSSEDAFRSIGIEQADVFQYIIKKTLPVWNANLVNMLVVLATRCGIGVDAYHSQLYAELNIQIRDSQQRDQLEKAARKLCDEQLKQVKATPKRELELKEELYLNHLNELVFYFKLIAGIRKEDITFFVKHSCLKVKDDKYSRMLDLVEMIGESEDWLKIYEEGIRIGVEFSYIYQIRYKRLSLA